MAERPLVDIVSNRSNDVGVDRRHDDADADRLAARAIPAVE